MSELGEKVLAAEAEGGDLLHDDVDGDLQSSVNEGVLDGLDGQDRPPVLAARSVVEPVVLREEGRLVHEVVKRIEKKIV